MTVPRSALLWGAVAALAFLIAANAVDYGRAELADFINPQDRPIWFGVVGSVRPVHPGGVADVLVISDRDPGCVAIELTSVWIGSDGIERRVNDTALFRPITADERGRPVERQFTAPDDIPPGMANWHPEVRFRMPCPTTAVSGDSAPVMIRAD